MGLAAIKDVEAMREIQRLKKEIVGLKLQLSTLTKNNTFTFGASVTLSPIMPDAGTGPAIWINTAANPWKAAVKLESATGRAEYVQFGKGLPT